VHWRRVAQRLDVAAKGYGPWPPRPVTSATGGVDAVTSLPHSEHGDAPRNARASESRPEARPGPGNKQTNKQTRQKNDTKSSDSSTDTKNETAPVNKVASVQNSFFFGGGNE